MLHGVPHNIVFDRVPKFVSKFCESLNAALGADVKLSTAFHVGHAIWWYS